MERNTICLLGESNAHMDYDKNWNEKVVTKNQKKILIIILNNAKPIPLLVFNCVEWMLSVAI